MADEAAARLEKRQELDRLFEARRKKKEEKRAAAKAAKAAGEDVAAKAAAEKAAADKAAAEKAAAEKAAADAAAQEAAFQAAVAAQAKIQADKLAAEEAARKDAEAAAAAEQAAAAAAQAAKEEAARVEAEKAAAAKAAADKAAADKAAADKAAADKAAADKAAAEASKTRAANGRVGEANKAELKAKILQQATDRVAKERTKRGIPTSSTPDPAPPPAMRVDEIQGQEEFEQIEAACLEESGGWDALDENGEELDHDAQFEELDVNNDGVISRDEYHHAQATHMLREAPSRVKPPSRRRVQRVPSSQEGQDEYSPDEIYEMELESKNAEIELLRQQLVSMGSPPPRVSNSKIRSVGAARKDTQVDAVSPSRRSVRRRCWMCKVHPEEEIKFLSKDTYELLCRDCLLVGAHQGHAYCTIDDAAQDARKVLQSAMDQVLHKEHDLSHAVKLLNKSMPSLERQQVALMDSVAKEFGKVQAAIDLRRAEIEHSLLEAFRNASSQSTSRLKTLQHQQQALREACNRAHDALHAYSDMDLLSNAAEIESELEEASVFPDSALDELSHQTHASIPTVQFNTESMFDEVALFGVLVDQQQQALIVDPEPAETPSPASSSRARQRPKSAGSISRSRRHTESPQTPDTLSHLARAERPRPASAHGRRRASYSSIERGYASAARSPSSSRFKWLTAPVTMTTTKPPIKAVKQKRHYAQ